MEMKWIFLMVRLVKHADLINIHRDPFHFFPGKCIFRHGTERKFNAICVIID